MTVLQVRPQNTLPQITWEKLPADFPLPDEPVENNLQPLLAAALRESLELAGLILESMLIASNFGLCATVGDKTIGQSPRLGLRAFCSSSTSRRNLSQLHSPY